MPDPTLDPAALAELLETVGGDREFLAELIETYLGDSPGLFEELRAGLTTGDAHRDPPGRPHPEVNERQLWRDPPGGDVPGDRGCRECRTTSPT